MSVESRLYSILGSVFSNEFYPVVHPDPDGTSSEVAALYAVYSKVGGGTTKTLQGTGNLKKPRMQISIYGINFDDVVTKELAVIAAMDAANVLANQTVDAGGDPLNTTGSLPNLQIGQPVDDYEPFTKRFVKRIEFYIWQRD